MYPLTELVIDYSCLCGEALNFLGDVTPLCSRLIFCERGQLRAVSSQYAEKQSTCFF